MLVCYDIFRVSYIIVNILLINEFEICVYIYFFVSKIKFKIVLVVKDLKYMY